MLSECLGNQGAFARVVGDLTLAATLIQEALALDRDAGNIAMMSIKLSGLGNMALQQGDYQRAAEFFADGLRLSGEVGFRWTTFEGIVGLAGVSSARGRYGRAARLYGAAETLREAIGHHPSPQAQEVFDRRLASTRRGLGEVAFPAAWAEGRAMTLEQAVEYALADV